MKYLKTVLYFVEGNDIACSVTGYIILGSSVVIQKVKEKGLAPSALAAFLSAILNCLWAFQPL